ncbi:probable 3-hydroxyisobutyryl-CoA hydrolase, mitochondrial precursor [Rhynchosporium agropyri]|uniref:3-hydroxyisobutyryl-CoA hydrolase n=1 Tax=Rhynchosporium agropyri TaxID=914238 RepID=A0A1E1KBF1_9HELO|nr:probable 3-hydroxyisobutyryl-CoA hydrolase, mitochondrial precursor [Rhynchosporium agropyri]
MPLRAKITNPAIAGRVQMSSSPSRQDLSRTEAAEVIKELPGDEPEDVLFNTLFGVRTIELNRPKTLHSLNGSMIRKIVPRLQEWAKSDMANVIIIKGSGAKAFCAGGDVKHLAEENLKGWEGQRNSTDYFALEYKLDHLIATYKKPYVAFMDGITMGGGVGLSIHAPFRIATERTVFAMPETTIGFFPDVGASFFLPRMSGGVGTYLALTSEKLKGVNAFYAGIATHYIHSTSLPALEHRLAELRFKDYDSKHTRLTLIDSTIEEFCTGLPHDEPMLIQGKLRDAIDRCFTKTNVPDLIAALKAEEDEEVKAWAEKTIATLYHKSPTSIYVTLRQMQLGRTWSIKDTFHREHQMAGKFMRHPDFTEGVSALLIRKDNRPVWQPASLDDVKPEDNISEPFFQVEGANRLQLLNETDYTQYPHSEFGLPRESDVQELVMRTPKSRKAIVTQFIKERKGKQGVKEVVAEILRRRTTVTPDNKAVWAFAEGVQESGAQATVGQASGDGAATEELSTGEVAIGEEASGGSGGAATGEESTGEEANGEDASLKKPSSE